MQVKKDFLDTKGMECNIGLVTIFVKNMQYGMV